MEPLVQQLRSLPSRAAQLPKGARVAGLVALALAAVIVLVALPSSTARYSYLVTDLAPEDQPLAAAALREAGVPHRFEAGGSALAVPDDRVVEARLALATQGLPRAAGVGFELFDRSDLGVSEFTQNVNLRRAVEGELARTIVGLGAVKSARVHVRMARRGLFREEDEAAAASVVVHLHEGRSLTDRQVEGIRHLVGAAVPGLAKEGVTVVDGSGRILSTEESAAAADAARDFERDLEARVTSLLEPLVGKGAVVARVTAEMETKRVETRARRVDADNPAVKQEQHTNVLRPGAEGGRGIAGSAGNLGDAAGAAAPTTTSTAAEILSESESTNYELSTNEEATLIEGPRVRRLSVAVVVAEATPVRSDEEIERLTALASHAVGLDAARGDRLQVTSAPFQATGAGAASSDEGSAAATLSGGRTAAIAAVVALALAALAGAVWMKRKRAADRAALAVLAGGGRVGELERALVVPGARAVLAPPAPTVEQSDAEKALLHRARELTRGDSSRAAHLLRAWLGSPVHEEGRHG